jgi:hypothetical protein
MASSLSVTPNQQILSNSTTYIDLLGVNVGLTRMAGESSTAFAERVRRAAVLDRTASYRGLMNEICLQFGIEMFEAISLNGPIDAEVLVTLAGVQLLSIGGASSFQFPICEVDVDGFWRWKSLSDVVAAINQTTPWTAALLCPDGPAFQLVLQNNSVLALNEPISGQSVKLKNRNLVPASESFNQPVPAYTSDGSILIFSTPLPSGVTVTYRHIVSPYALIASPVFLMSMLDPNFGAIAQTPAGDITYQTKELLNELLKRDASYWTL